MIWRVFVGIMLLLSSVARSAEPSGQDERQRLAALHRALTDGVFDFAAQRRGSLIYLHWMPQIPADVDRFSLVDLRNLIYRQRCAYVSPQADATADAARVLPDVSALSGRMQVISIPQSDNRFDWLTVDPALVFAAMQKTRDLKAGRNAELNQLKGELAKRNESMSKTLAARIAEQEKKQIVGLYDEIVAACAMEAKAKAARLVLADSMPDWPPDPAAKVEYLQGIVRLPRFAGPGDITMHVIKRLDADYRTQPKPSVTNAPREPRVFVFAAAKAFDRLRQTADRKRALEQLVREKKSAEANHQAKQGLAELSSKLMAAAGEVGRQRGAVAVLVSWAPDVSKLEAFTVDQLRAALLARNFLYIDPASDITSAVVEQMDAAYAGK